MWPKWARMSFGATFGVYSRRDRGEKITLETFPPRKFCVAVYGTVKSLKRGRKAALLRALPHGSQRGSGSHFEYLFEMCLRGKRERLWFSLNWRALLWFLNEPSSHPARPCLSRVSALVFAWIFIPLIFYINIFNVDYMNAANIKRYV